MTKVPKINNKVKYTQLLFAFCLGIFSFCGILLIFQPLYFSEYFIVVEVEDFFTWKLNNQGCPESVNHDHHNRKPRQFIEKRFLENGSFYIFSPRILRKYKNRMGEKMGFKVMEKHKMFQIDTIEDIRLCEVIMQGYHLNSL